MAYDCLSRLAKGSLVSGLKWVPLTVLNIPRQGWYTHEWASTEELLPLSNLRHCWNASSLQFCGDESPWAVSESIRTSAVAAKLIVDPLSTKAALLLKPAAWSNATHHPFSSTLDHTRMARSTNQTLRPPISCIIVTCERPGCGSCALAWWGSDRQLGASRTSQVFKPTLRATTSQASQDFAHAKA